MATSSPYKIRLWYPYTAEFDFATAAIEMKAPEIGNKEDRARNQSIVRTRAGTSLVYDRARNYNELKSFEFRAIKDEEKLALQTFLEAVQWGVTRLAYQDWNGTQYIIRINTTQMTYTDTGYIGRDSVAQIDTLWDFNIQYMDITNNLDELEGLDPVVNSPLALHEADFNEPHNPRKTVNVTYTDGTVVIENQSVDSFNSINWNIKIRCGAAVAAGCLHLTHDGTPSTDATTVKTLLEQWIDPTGLFTNLVFSTTLDGTGSDQVVILSVTTPNDGLTYTIGVRRYKI